MTDNNAIPEDQRVLHCAIFPGQQCKVTDKNLELSMRIKSKQFIMARTHITPIHPPFLSNTK